MLNRFGNVMFWIPLVLGCAGQMQAADRGRGIELYENQKYAEAVTELRGFLEENPDDPPAHYYLALALIHTKDYEAARKHLVAAEERRGEAGPRPDQIRAAQSQLETELKNYDEARRLAGEALKIKEDSPEAHFALGYLAIQQKQYAEAAKSMERVIEIAPKTPYAYYFAGIAYSNLRRPDRMVNSFQTFLKLAPDAPEADKVRSLLRSVR